MVLPTQGLREILPLKKRIEPPAETHCARYVRLRFTRKQYDAFRAACDALQMMSLHEEYINLVQLAMGSKVNPRVIASQITDPIVHAPTKVAIAGPRAPPKVTHLTAPVKPSEKCMQLYARISSDVPNTRHAIESGATCITDIRLMISKYIAIHDLKTEQGTVMDTFLQSIAPSTFARMKHVLMYVDNRYIIPRKDRQVIVRMVNEIAV